MSDFAISSEQRRRLLAGDYTALKFRIKPCNIGDRYVLAWRQKEVRVYQFEDGSEPFTLHVPKHPVWFLTVTRVDRVDRNAEVNWRVRFDVTDLRDHDTFLRPGGGVQAGHDPLRAGRVPDPGWLDSEAEAISEFWEGRRLERVEAEGRRRAAWKRDRRAA